MGRWGGGGVREAQGKKLLVESFLKSVNHVLMGNFLRKIYASLICFVGSLQLLTQGSADVVLEACTDYWDGKSLCPVTASERYVYVRT